MLNIMNEESETTVYERALAIYLMNRYLPTGKLTIDKDILAKKLNEKTLLFNRDDEKQTIHVICKDRI